MPEALIKKTQLEQAQRIASSATQLFNETQIEVNKERITSGERVGYFCAGAISLSFTLTGFLFSNPTTSAILQEDFFFHIPLAALLIIGWILLFISVVASMLIRFFNSLYLNYSRAQYWSSKNIESQQKTIEAIQAGVGFVYTDASDDATAVSNINRNIDGYSELEVASKRRAKFWLKALNLAQAFLFTGAVSGLIIFVLFLVIITFKLVI